MEKATIIGIDLAKRVFQVHAAALSRQTSIGHFRRRIRPSASAIHEQKQWSSAPP